MEDEYYEADTLKKFGPRSRKTRDFYVPELAVEFVKIALKQELKEALERSPHSAINANINYPLDYKSDKMPSEKSPEMVEAFIVDVIKSLEKRRFEIRVTAGDFQMQFNGQFNEPYREKEEKEKVKAERERQIADLKEEAHLRIGILYDG